jgi:hypothetical protein
MRANKGAGKLVPILKERSFSKNEEERAGYGKMK